MMDDLKPEGVPATGDSFSQTGINTAPIQEEQSDVAVEEATPDTPVEAAQTPTQSETAQAKNFRNIKEAAERAARERDDAVRRLQEYERKYAAPPQVQEVEEEYDGDDIDLDTIKDDDLVEGKHFVKVKNALKKIQQQQRAFQKRTQETTAEARLRSQYPDFDKVMTIDNMRALSEASPELARSINASKDLYDKAVAAYTSIKRFGIYEDEPYAAEKERAVSNTMKPRPTNSISPQQGNSPLSRANMFENGLTEDLKKKLRAEMAAASRKY